ncbi:hypothetical protein Hanom_Chr02g00117071 [Helianthus anomalus]
MVKLDKIIMEAGGLKIRLKYELYEFRDFNPNLKVQFSWIEVWKGLSLPYERISWSKNSGVPLHLMDNEVFDSVGRLSGKVVHAPSLTCEDKDLTFDLIGVLVRDDDRICDSVTLKWKDKKFKVWVDEELGDWVPDCISDEDSWEVSSRLESGNGEQCIDTSSTSPELDESPRRYR